MILKISITAASPFRSLAPLNNFKGLLRFIVLSAYSFTVGQLCKTSSGGSAVLALSGARCLHCRILTPIRK